ncbi:MAG: iron-sulfur cluster insertion protein ErpA [Anaerolineae bacterium]|nr:iron-sulfur cluster insertion protein ErpA [Anaerolineae bacterium]MCA9894818.1 iron-sulfur cluster insertion protein ErpA [Anaerolineae bacterium]MCB9459818.1 iron-sulfur cluster insertion protein ErpA [Anaerolineaceae bacterium]
MALIDEPKTTEVEEAVLVVTPTAVDIIKNLLEQRNIPGYALRVFVTGGGCSGLQYGMSFEEGAQDSDAVVSANGVTLLVDPTSLVYLKGATIDFVDSLIGGGFRIDNPNAISQCGCGSSFKAEDGSGADADGCGCGTCSSSY